MAVSVKSPRRKTQPGRLFVVSAPSGAGKTSLVDALLKVDDNLRVSVSHTTRPRRTSEIDGTHYHFVPRAEFDRMIGANEFLEHACVFGNSYGTAKASVGAMLDAGQDVILEIDWQGAAQVRDRWEETRGDSPALTSIFILPPSRRTLIERLRGRAQDNEDVIERRSREAAEEISHYAEFDYPIVNDDFDVALAEMTRIIEAARSDTALAKRNVDELVAQLLEPAPG